MRPLRLYKLRLPITIIIITLLLTLLMNLYVNKNKENFYKTLDFIGFLSISNIDCLFYYFIILLFYYFFYYLFH
jgi:chromate transport protein ChrA